MSHQTEAVRFITSNPDSVFNMSGCGTGKTAMHIIAYSELLRRGSGDEKMIVLAPKSLLDAAWAEDLQKFAPWLSFSVARAGKRREAFEQDANVYITNVDAAADVAEMAKSKKFRDRIFTTGSILLCDECSAFKHATSIRSKAAAKLAQHADRVHMLSATPNSRTITDIWHQAFMCDNGKRLGNSFYQFRNQVCSPVQVGMSPNAVQWQDKPGAEQVVMALLQDITLRYTLEQCVEMPANHTYSIKYKLTPKQRKAYEQMKELAIVELSDGKHITAVNAAIVANKLLQIASGAVYDGSRLVHAVDDARYELVCDLVDARAHSLVAFQWTHQRDALIRHFEKNGWSWTLIDGTVNDKDRMAAVRAMQNGELKVLLCHPQSAGHGLTLTRATATIWASPTFNAELMEQFRHRIYRKGQTDKTENILVVAEDTYDERAAEVCEGRVSLMNSLLSLAEK